MSRVRLPSVQVDLVVEDHLDAEAASIVSINRAPFDITDGQTLDVDIDGAGVQNLVFNEVDFDDITRATIEELVAVINAQITGAVASDDNGSLRLTSNTFGTTSSIAVSGEPQRTAVALPSFDLPAGPTPGVNATGGVFLVNRVPEPNEVGVPLSDPVVLDIHDTGGTAPASSEIQITIDGMLAYDGGAGGFQAGFSGSTALIDAATRRLTIQPDTAFASETVIDVDVLIGTPSFSDTYSFTTEDTEAPGIDSVVAQDKKRVRVVFTDEVKQESPTQDDDALNPANYSFMGASIPYVDLTPVGVETVDARTVDVLVDVEMTFGALYNVTIVNVVDTSENPIVSAPDNCVDFTGFLPPFPQGRRFMLSEFIPTLNIQEDVTKELRYFLAVLQDVTNLLLCNIDEWVDILDLDRAPEEFLDAMLADLGNPFDRFDLEENDKRRLLRVLLGIYKLKGTGAGVIAVIRFFLEIEVGIDIFNGEGWELALDSTDQIFTVVDTSVSNQPTVGITEAQIGLQEQLEVELNGVVVATAQSYTRDSLPGDELSGHGVDGSPPAQLGPDQYGLYSFAILSPVNLTREQAEGIIFLANYMKPGHTHLVQIIQPDPPSFSLLGLGVPVVGAAGVVFDHAELGVSELGGLLPGQPGFFVLH